MAQQNPQSDGPSLRMKDVVVPMALAAFGLIQVLLHRRRERRDETLALSFVHQHAALLDERERRVLVKQLSSHVPGFAAEAVRLLRFQKGLLKEDVAKALQSGADFQYANLQAIDLSGRRLFGAKLRNSDLRWAKLDFADLYRAQLKGAVPKGATEVTIEQLRSAKTLEGCILPDGTRLPANDDWRSAFEVWAGNMSDKGRLRKVQRCVWDAERKRWDHYFVTVTEHEIIIDEEPPTEAG